MNVPNDSLRLEVPETSEVWHQARDGKRSRSWITWADRIGGSDWGGLAEVASLSEREQHGSAGDHERCAAGARCAAGHQRMRER